MNKKNPQPSEVLQLSTVINACWNRRWWIILIIVLGVCGGGYYSSKQPKVYMSQASVLYEAPMNGLGDTRPSLKVEITRAQAVLAMSRPVLAKVEALAGEKIEPINKVTPSFNAQIEEQLMYLQVTDGDPERAAKFANAWVAAFVDELASRAQAPTVSAKEFMGRALPDIQRDLQKKKDQLNEFVKTTNFDLNGGDLKPTEAMLLDLNTKIKTREIELARLAAEKDVVEKKKDTPRELFNLPRARSTPSLMALSQSYESQREELRSQLEATKLKFSKDSPQLALMNERLRNLELTLNSVTPALFDQISMERDLALVEKTHLEQIVTEAKQKLDKAREHAAQYDELKAELTRVQTTYDDWIKRKENSELLGNFMFSYARPWEKAEPNFSPILPNSKKDLLIAFMGAIGAALMLVGALEVLEYRVRVPQDIERAFDAELCNLIPLLPRKQSGQAAYKMAFTHRHSFAADCLRNIKFYLKANRQADTEAGGLALAVTSAVPGEGKSFVSSNLAILFAGGVGKVLLVDFDTRQATLTKAYGLQNRPENINLLQMGEWKSEYAVPTDIPNLFVLPQPHGSKNGSMDRECMKKLVDAMRKDFSVIVFDMHPVLALSDACVLGGTLDYTLMVARSRVTTYNQMRRAVSMLHGQKDIHVHFILNGVPAEDVRGDTHYYSEAGYGQKKPKGAVSETTPVSPTVPAAPVAPLTIPAPSPTPEIPVVASSAPILNEPAVSAPAADLALRSELTAAIQHTIHAIGPEKQASPFEHAEPSNGNGNGNGNGLEHSSESQAEPFLAQPAATLTGPFRDTPCRAN